jgi:hypothetical protein
MKSHPLAAALLPAALAAVLAFAAGCAQPVMPVPAELPKPVDVYEVSGRFGIVLLEPKIRFGPYITVQIRRGMTEGVSSANSEGLLKSEKHREAQQVFEFTLEGPGGRPWKTHCVYTQTNHATSEVTGVHIDANGVSPHVKRRETETSKYECELEGPDGEHWFLATDGERYRGSVLDKKGNVVLEISTRLVSRPGKWDGLEAYLFTDGDGMLVAAVQRTYDGVVMLPASFTAPRRAGLAAVATALLIPGG